MTQSNFKYSSGQAGGTLFDPKKESKPFQPFDIQAASQPLIAALEKNIDTEVNNYKRTADYGLETMRIEQSHDLVVQEHNARVSKLNDEYDLEQFAKFSQAAQSLVTQGLEIRKESQLNAGYAKVLDLQTKKPNEYKTFIREREKFIKEDGKYKNKAFVEAWKLKVNDPILSKAFLDASGWERQAIFNATLGDRLANLGKQMQVKNSTVSRNMELMLAGISKEDYLEFQKDSTEDFNEKSSFTYDQLVEYVDKNYKGKTWPKYLTHLDTAYRGAAAGELIKSFQPGRLIDYATMLEKVQPAINQVAHEGAINYKERYTAHHNKTLRDLKDGEVGTIFNSGLNQGQNYTSISFQTAVEGDWQAFQTGNMTEAEAREASLEAKLEKVLLLQGEGRSSVNLVEIYGLFNGQVSSRGLKKGQTKSFGELYSKVFEKINFLNRAEEQSRIRHNIKTKTRENGKKMMLAAAAEHVRINGGSLSTVQVREFARAGAARGWGTESDLTLAIIDAMPTDLGKSIDEWVEVIKKDKSKSNGKLNPEDYLKRGVPKEAVEHADVKDMFHKDAKWSISNADQKLIEGQLASNFTGIKDKTIATKDLNHEQQWAGQNAYQKYFLGEYERLISEKGDKIKDPMAIRKQAIINTQAWMKDENNWPQLEVKPDLLTERRKVSDRGAEQVLTTPTGSADSMVIDEFREQVEWFWNEHYPAVKKANPNVNPMDLVTSDLQWTDSNGMKKAFFSPNWNDAEYRTRSPNLLIDQGKALGKEIKHEQPLPGDTSERFEVLYQIDEELATQIFTGQSPAQQQLAELKKNKPRGRTKGKTVGGVEIGGGGLVIKTDEGVPVVTQWKRDIKALEAQVKAEDLIDKPYSSMNASIFFGGALGVAMEPFELALAGSGTNLQAFFTQFKKDRGLKEADLHTEEAQKQMRTILWNMYGPQAYPSIEDQEDWEPVQWPTVWDYIGGKR